MQSNNRLPQITLDEYLVYLEQGASFDAESYLQRVTETISGTERSRPLSEVEIDSAVDTQVPGVYEVTYQYSGETGTGQTILTVVVE